MASILPNGKTQFVDQNGRPLVGGSVYYYAPGTENPMTTWQDQAETIPNANPVVFDSRGQATIWGSGTYRQVVYDRNGLLIWDQVVSDPTLALQQSIAGIATTFAAAGGAALVGFEQAGSGAVPRTVQAELRDSLTLKQFGCKGDWNGATGTDDSAAFQAAVTYAGSLSAVTGKQVMLVAPPGAAYRLASAQITWASGVVLWAFGATFVCDGPAYVIRGDTLNNVSVIGGTFIDNQPTAAGGTTAVRFSNASNVLLAYNTATNFKQFGFATGQFSGTDVCNDVTYLNNKVFAHGKSGVVTAIGIVHRPLSGNRLTFIGNTVQLDPACMGTACKLQETTDIVATGNIFNRPAGGVGSGSQCFMITDSTNVVATGNLVDNSDVGGYGAIAVSNCTNANFSGNNVAGSNQNCYLTQTLTEVLFKGNQLASGVLYVFNSVGVASGVHMLSNDVLSLIVQDKTSLNDIVVRDNNVRSVLLWTAPGTTLAQDLFCENNSVNLASNAHVQLLTPNVVFANNRIFRSPVGSAQSNTVLVSANNVELIGNTIDSNGDAFSVTLSNGFTGIVLKRNTLSGYASAQGWLGFVGSSGYVAQHNVDANGKKDSFGETVSLDRGDSNAGLTIASETVQVFNTPLSADRTVTLPTTLSAGAKFRVVRTAAASGGSNLIVGGLKNLGAGQWCDVHLQGNSWIVTASGSL